MSELTKFVGTVAATSTSVNFLIVVFVLEQYLSNKDAPRLERRPFYNAAIVMNATIVLSVASLGVLFGGYLFEDICLDLPVFGLVTLLEFGTVSSVFLVCIQLIVLVGGILWITKSTLNND